MPATNGVPISRTRVIVTALCIAGALATIILTSLLHFDHRRNQRSAPRVYTPAPALPDFESPYAAYTPSVDGLSLDDIEAEVSLLSRQPPLYYDALQAHYREAPDLYALVMDWAPAAQQGDASAEYHLYLALEECRAYLGPNGVATLQETTLKPFWRHAAGDNEDSNESDLERALWLQEYHRCKNFVGANLLLLELAMGEEKPGDITEYGAVWFERAYRHQYPLAITDMALRLSTLDSVSRRALLHMAIPSEDPLVFLSLFERARDHRARPGAWHEAVAWLIVACQKGLDCRESADWFLSRVCAVDRSANCRAGVSALHHFWSLLNASEKISAYSMAFDINRHLRAGNLKALPWPGESLASEAATDR